ncbi:MAG: DUF3842 family protein [Oscillospiraceae bacterium]|nr:DUF3842 family protein [Oscillospiraceae bacterium]
MTILVIDGMGGGIGRTIIERIKAELKQPNMVEVIAVGTNSVATTNMIKAGADFAATGENAVVYNCGKADYIIGVTGIVFTNSMHGEISPMMAAAVSGSDAHKILIPIDRCNTTVLGVVSKPIQSYIDEIVRVIDFS